MDGEDLDKLAVQQSKRVIDASVGKATKLQMHLLPCHAKNSAVANVNEFFMSTMKKCEDLPQDSTSGSGGSGEGPFYTAALRGRQLTGPLVKVPDGFSGHVLSEQRTKGDTERVAWKEVGTFDEFHMWNRDSNRHERDDLRRAVVEWPALAEMIHSPV